MPLQLLSSERSANKIFTTRHKWKKDYLLLCRDLHTESVKAISVCLEFSLAFWPHSKGLFLLHLSLGGEVVLPTVEVGPGAISAEFTVNVLSDPRGEAEMSAQLSYTDTMRQLHPWDMERQGGITDTFEHISTLQQRDWSWLCVPQLWEKPSEEGAGLWQHSSPLWPPASRVGQCWARYTVLGRCPCLFLLEGLCSVPHAVMEVCWVSPGLLQCMGLDIPAAYLNHPSWFSGSLLLYINPCNFITSLCLETSALILLLQTTAPSDSHCISISKMNQWDWWWQQAKCKARFWADRLKRMNLGVNLMSFGQIIH